MSQYIKRVVDEVRLRELKETKDLAKLCFQDEKFKKYKDSFEKNRQLLIDKMLFLDFYSLGIENYAIAMKAYCDNINILGELLNHIEKDK